MKAVRWIAVPFAIIAAWYVALLSGLEAFSFLSDLCPAELRWSSGACGASWFDPALNSLIVLFAGIAAFLVVVSAACMAPSHKLVLAWEAYSVGFAFAVFAVAWEVYTLGFDGERLTVLFAAFFSAVLFGLFAVFCVAKYLGLRMVPNKASRVPRQSRAP